MIAYQDALQIILAQAGHRQTEVLPLLSALGKISAVELTSGMDVPSFRNSAMDGFAVRNADLAGATAEQPVSMRVLWAIAAGDVAVMQTAPGAVQIMTGARVPEPYDAVVPIERVTVDGDRVSFSRPAQHLDHIRLPGEDVRHGQTVLRAGDVITAERIMLLASLGVAQIEVYTVPPLHILSTGKEIVEHSPTPLPEGKIYNSNAPYLLARCMAEGLSAQYGGIIADDAETFETHLRSVPVGSVIITTGAVSKGIWDFIPGSLNKLGATTHFHRVNIRPGKPVLFATLPNGSWFFGLPGNPISAAIGFRFFVLPLLRALQGLAAEEPVMARLENPFTKKSDFRHFLKATLKIGAAGELVVSISTGQQSFQISPMADSNAWVALDEQAREYTAGALVPVFPFQMRGGFPWYKT